MLATAEISTIPSEEQIATCWHFDEALKAAGAEEPFWIAQKVIITPDKAGEIYASRRMALERKPTPGVWRKYSASMRTGKFFRLDLMGFGDTAKNYPGVAEGIEPLFNGQHRLLAGMDTRLAMLTDIRFNIPWAAYPHLDTPRVREAYAQLRWLEGISLGDVSATGLWALAKRAILITREGQRHQLGNARMPYTHEEIIEVIQQGVISLAAEMGWRFRGSVVSAPAPVALACYVILSESKVPGKEGLLQDFLRKLEFGRFTDEDDPVYELRERLIAEHQDRNGDRYKNARVTHFILRTWNMIMSGEKFKLRSPEKSDPILRPL